MPVHCKLKHQEFKSWLVNIEFEVHRSIFKLLLETFHIFQFICIFTYLSIYICLIYSLERVVLVTGCDIVTADMIFLVEASNRVRAPINYWNTMIDFIAAVVDESVYQIVLVISLY